MNNYPILHGSFGSKVENYTYICVIHDDFSKYNGDKKSI